MNGATFIECGVAAHIQKEKKKNVHKSLICLFLYLGVLHWSSPLGPVVGNSGWGKLLLKSFGSY